MKTHDRYTKIITAWFNLKEFLYGLLFSVVMSDRKGILYQHKFLELMWIHFSEQTPNASYVFRTYFSDAVVMCPSICLSVCHQLVLYQNS